MIELADRDGKNGSQPLLAVVWRKLCEMIREKKLCYTCRIDTTESNC